MLAACIITTFPFSLLLGGVAADRRRRLLAAISLASERRIPDRWPRRPEVGFSNLVLPVKVLPVKFSSNVSQFGMHQHREGLSVTGKMALTGKTEFRNLRVRARRLACSDPRIGFGRPKLRSRTVWSSSSVELGRYLAERRTRQRCRASVLVASRRGLKDLSKQIQAL